MGTHEEVLAYFENDRFASMQGISIEQVGDGSAVCSVQLGAEHCNAAGSVQGGLIFTLADFAFAVAANSQSIGTVTLDATIHFLKPGLAGRLTATATRTAATRTISVYRVDITDEGGSLIAQSTVTGFTKQPRPAGE